MESSEKKYVFFEMTNDKEKWSFTSSIKREIDIAQSELQDYEDTLNTIEFLKPHCDKLDYCLAAGVGALCGLFDIFLVGKPGESPLQNLTDSWVQEITENFAKLFGWENGSFSSAIRFLEEKFKIPYDQRGAGDAGSIVFDLNPNNHHFKSLAHNPSLLGLFFSIVDQFTNSSHFVTNGNLISLVEADGKFSLYGENIPTKFFCAVVNWFGHLLSDLSGSSNSRGRGMGIPSPLWTWTNSIIALKNSAGFQTSQFDKFMNQLALDIYKKGYDARFQAVQAIPVFVNEMSVRLIYSIRRLVQYFHETPAHNRSISSAWKMCEPFSNPTVKRMLTVSHATFCLLDIGDAAIRGILQRDGIEFILRLNIVGVGRLLISIYGEISRKANIQREIIRAERGKEIAVYYLQGLKEIATQYDNEVSLYFVDYFQKSDMYKIAFEYSIKQADFRNVPKEKSLRSMEDINLFFGGNKK